MDIDHICQMILLSFPICSWSIQWKRQQRLKEWIFLESVSKNQHFETYHNLPHSLLSHMAINLRALYTKQNLIPRTFSRQKDFKISQCIRKLRCNLKLRWSSVHPVVVWSIFGWSKWPWDIRSACLCGPFSLYKTSALSSGRFWITYHLFNSNPPGCMANFPSYFQFDHRPSSTFNPPVTVTATIEEGITPFKAKGYQTACQRSLSDCVLWLQSLPCHYRAR